MKLHASLVPLFLAGALSSCTCWKQVDCTVSKSERRHYLAPGIDHVTTVCVTRNGDLLASGLSHTGGYSNPRLVRRGWDGDTVTYALEITPPPGSENPAWLQWHTASAHIASDLADDRVRVFRVIGRRDGIAIAR